MNKKIKHFVGLGLFMLALVPMINVKALDVSTEEELKAALVDGGDITLTSNIAVKSPLMLKKEAVIDGGNFTLSADPLFVSDGANGSILTVADRAEVVLSNITISGAKKYGVQAYAGGVVAFNKVIIKNSGYGAVLLNGGGAAIIDLHLEGNAYGIEFGKGVNVTEDPALMMSGKLTHNNQVDLLYLATNDNLGAVTVGNAAGSEMTFAVVDGKKLELKDKDGNVVATSNEAKAGVVVEEEEVTEPTPEPKPEPTPTPNPDNKVDENPETGDNVITYAVLALAGLGALLISSKKLAKN